MERADGGHQPIEVPTPPSRVNANPSNLPAGREPKPAWAPGTEEILGCECDSDPAVRLEKQLYL